MLKDRILSCVHDLGWAAMLTMALVVNVLIIVPFVVIPAHIVVKAYREIRDYFTYYVPKLWEVHLHGLDLVRRYGVPWVPKEAAMSKHYRKAYYQLSFRVGGNDD